MRRIINAVPVAVLVALWPLAIAAETVAILPVKLLDTSNETEGQSAAHEARQRLLTEVLTQELGDTVLLDEAAIADCAPQTTGCLLETARASGGGHALFIVTHKTSSLILEVYANLVVSETGRVVLSRQLSFRGDTDESWRRAARFLARQIRDATKD